MHQLRLFEMRLMPVGRKSVAPSADNPLRRGNAGQPAISEDRGGAKLVAPFVAAHDIKSVKLYLDPESSPW